MGRHVYAVVGRTLDRASQNRGKHPQRFVRRWRPSVGLAQFSGITHLHLIAAPLDLALAAEIRHDAQLLNPALIIEIDTLAFDNPWDLPSTYLTLLNYIQEKTEHLDECQELFLQITTGTHIQQIVFFLLAESKRFRGKLLQSIPDKENRSNSQFQVIDLDLSKYDIIATRFHQERTHALSALKGGIKTRNARFNALIEEIEAVVSASESPILLMGPTGAGKSGLARRIYDIKKQTRLVSGALVAVNCATLRGDNAMSALFGHRKGAFTGAHADREGLLRKADKGLLFLDEIGELGLEEQAMLLSAIEERQFYPLGSDQPVSSQFQLIAGTNQYLRQRVAEGSFREDLLARINLWEFHLPSLRERREDIEPNIDYELDRLGLEMGRRIRLQGEARNAYLQFALSGQALWSGNFRDLIASLTRLATLAPDGVVTEHLVAREIERLQQSWFATAKDPAANNSSLLEKLLTPHRQSTLDSLDAIDRHTLEYVAHICQGSKNAAEASRALFDQSRLARKSTNDTDRLKKYLQAFGLVPADLLPVK